MRLILIAFFLFSITDLCRAQSFYAVLVADTKDPSLGSSCEKDLEEMSLLLNGIAKKINFQYKELICSKEQFGKSGIDKALSELQCAPEDILFFYYTGHGLQGSGSQSAFPVLRLKDHDMELETIHTLLKEKKAKFCLTLGDCCNNLFAGTRSMRPPLPLFKGIGVTKDTEILNRLFVESKGDLLISSAKKGERATAHPSGGSFYSTNWIQALAYAQSHNANITWGSLLLDAENRLQETLSAFPDSLKHHSQWVQHIVEPPLPCPGSGFDQINQFLNQLADEDLSFQERNRLRAKKRDQFFKNTAQVSIYIQNPEKPVEIQSVDQFLKRVVNTAPLIDRFNFVERMSEISDGCLYERVTLQEVRRAD